MCPASLSSARLPLKRPPMNSTTVKMAVMIRAIRRGLTNCREDDPLPPSDGLS
jgi:hypothetical protein